MRYNVQVYVDGQRLDLSKEVPIVMRNKIKDVKDIKKVFSSFTNTFRVPATKTNNKIFKHVTRTDSDNTDPRKYYDARIEINNAPFAEGFIKLDGDHTYKSGRIHEYSLRFTDKFAQIGQLMGETKLDQLEDLSKYAVNFSQDQIHNLLKHGPDDTLGTGTDEAVSSDVADNVRYVLNSYDGVYFFDSSPTYDSDNDNIIDNDTKDSNGVSGIDDDQLHNIADSTAAVARERDGIRLRQLFPSLRMNAILEGIEAKEWYQDSPTLNFSRGLDSDGYPTSVAADVATNEDHFFNTDVWKDAYFLMKTKSATVASGGIIEWANDWQERTKNDHRQGNSKYLVTVRPYRANFNNNQNYYIYLKVATTSTNRWRIRLVEDQSGKGLYTTGWQEGDFTENTSSSLKVEGSSLFASLNQTAVTDILNTSDNVTVAKGDTTVAAFGPLASLDRGDRYSADWKLYIDSENDEIMTIDKIDITIVEAEQDKDFAERFTNKVYFYNNSVSDLSVGKSSIPDMTISKWFEGVIKMFNLVAYYDRDGKGEDIIVVDTLNNFYANGETRDITEWVDHQEYAVKAPEAYSDIQFKYEDPKTFLAKEFQESYDQAYGNLEHDLRVDEDDNLVAPLLPKNSYQIKLPFERVVLGDIYGGDPGQSGTTVDVFYGLVVDDGYSDTDVKPLVHYISNHTTAGNVDFLFKDESGDKVTVTDGQDYNVMTPFLRNSSDEVVQSLNFGVENDIIHAGDTLAEDDYNTLFKTYWRDYIVESFRPKAYRYKFKAKLPQNVLYDLSLGDTLIVADNSYRINEWSVNVNDGRTILELVSLNNPSITAIQSADAQVSRGVGKNTITISSFTVDPSNIFTADDTKRDFTVVAESELGAVTYKWFLNNTEISGATSSTYSATTLNNNDTYHVEVSDGTFTRSTETINLESDTNLVTAASVDDTTVSADGQTLTVTVKGTGGITYNVDITDAADSWITNAIFNEYFYEDTDIFTTTDVPDEDGNLRIIDNSGDDEDSVLVFAWDETQFNSVFTEATTSGWVIKNPDDDDNPFEIGSVATEAWTQDNTTYGAEMDSITAESIPEWLLDLSYTQKGNDYHLNTAVGKEAKEVDTITVSGERANVVQNSANEIMRIHIDPDFSGGQDTNQTAKFSYDSSLSLPASMEAGDKCESMNLGSGTHGFGSPEKFTIPAARQYTIKTGDDRGDVFDGVFAALDGYTYTTTGQSKNRDITFGWDSTNNRAEISYIDWDSANSQTFIDVIQIFGAGTSQLSSNRIDIHPGNGAVNIAQVGKVKTATSMTVDPDTSNTVYTSSLQGFEAKFQESAEDYLDRVGKAVAALETNITYDGNVNDGTYTEPTAGDTDSYEIVTKAPSGGSFTNQPSGVLTVNNWKLTATSSSNTQVTLPTTFAAYEDTWFSWNNKGETANLPQATSDTDEITLTFANGAVATYAVTGRNSSGHTSRVELGALSSSSGSVPTSYGAVKASMNGVWSGSSGGFVSPGDGNAWFSFGNTLPTSDAAVKALEIFFWHSGNGYTGDSQFGGQPVITFSNGYKITLASTFNGIDNAQINDDGLGIAFPNSSSDITTSGTFPSSWDDVTVTEIGWNIIDFTSKYIDIDTGTQTAIGHSATLTQGTGLNAYTIYAEGFDAVKGGGTATTITVTDPYGTEVTSFTQSSDNVSDDVSADIVTAINDAINNNTETPVDFTSTKSGKVITATAASNAYIDGTWSVSVNNHGQTTPPAGNISVSIVTTTEGREAVDGLEMVKAVKESRTNRVMPDSGTDTFKIKVPANTTDASRTFKIQVSNVDVVSNTKKTGTITQAAPA